MLASIVVFCTTYALILPAITMEKETICGIEEHKHTEECCTLVTTPETQALQCGYTAGHSHGDGCYDAEGNAVCGYADYYIHDHDDSCRGEDGELICPLDELLPHSHGDDCYEESVTYACGIEETPGHTHGDECYEKLRGELTCTTAETEGHSHDDTCRSLVCTTAESEGHSHDDACRSLVCTTAESEGHAHGEGCYVISCGLEETAGHAHTDGCYEYGCGLEESEAHAHGDECYAALRGELTCTEEEHKAHSHSEECGAETQRTLTCQKAEVSAHTHTEGCFNGGSVTCGMLQVTEHSHGDDCFLVTPASEESTLTCQLTEHTHSESCYPVEDGAVSYICGLEEHTHGDGCHDESGAVICTVTEHSHGSDCLPESAPAAGGYICGIEEHAHGDGCCNENGTLMCTMPLHSHDDSCLAAAEEEAVSYACGLEEHTHGDTCHDESGAVICAITQHSHTEECLTPAEEISDPTADVETAAQWESTLPDALSGVWADDVVAVAQSQLGYSESTLNFELSDDGVKNGYTRYGDWYGDTYGEWCAMFVSFCLHYAEVDEALFPIESSCSRWVALLDVTDDELAALTEGEAAPADLYKTADEHSPRPGDVIFFDVDEDAGAAQRSADHVGIVVEIIPAVETETESTPAMIKTIEGNKTHTVSYFTYELSDARILGYGVLPEKPQESESLTVYVCGLEEHSHGESCYDESGAVICTITQHSHTEDCAAALSASEQAHVDSVIAQLDALPTYEEVEATLRAYEEAGDMVSYESYYITVNMDGRYAYESYMRLTETQKLFVTNAYKLWDLESIWSAQVLIDEITSDEPTSISSAPTSEFIDLNLYNYGPNINDKYKSNNKYPGFQWNGGAYIKSSYDRHVVDYIDFGNSMITDFTYGSSLSSTNGKSSNNQNIANQGGDINKIDISDYYGVTNRPIGMSIGDDVLSRTLINDYPALADGSSLSYLFMDNEYAEKQNTASIDGLFQRDPVTGAYYYNSRENHAQYGNNRFTLYNQIITPNFIVYPFGNFLPFNDITDGSKATQVGKIQYVGGNGNVGYVQQIINDLWYDSSLRNQSTGVWYDATAQQLVEMLSKYRADLREITIGNGTAWTTWTAKDAIIDYFTGDGDNPSDDTGPITDELLNRMYNIDWDVETDFFFGMDMTMTFLQPKGGMTRNDTNQDGEPDYPMVFYFTGDDDVWVYIDDVLFLDLSGIHRHVGGEIDFVNGKVHYYHLDSSGSGDVSTTPYKTFTFAELLTAAGKSTDVLNAKGTFKDYSYHEFKFYYMERGSGSSVCRLNFNFPLLRQNSISVSKEVTSDTEVKGDPDYSFQVLKANSSGTKTETLFIGAGVQYTIYDDNNNEIGTGTTDANGVFTLKAGQRAEFAGIAENAGKYYVRELLDGTVLEQYGNITVSGESTTTSNNVTVGSDTFTGADSPVKDMSDGATAFRFTNDVDETKLGDLSISKCLTEYTAARAVKYYDIEVTLDGVKLPVGTTYTVGDATRTVTTAGIITIAADETALITNILAGTEFTVKETTGSAEGYIVTYTADNDYSVEQVTGGVKGYIITSAKVELVVTNIEKGAKIEIPVTKSLSNSDGAEHSYTFVLNEVTDATGAALKSGGVLDYRVDIATSGAENSSKFTLIYAKVDMGSLPATFYYRITENAADGVLTNDTVYIAGVTISETADGNIAAALTSLQKGVMVDGVPTGLTDCSETSADFVNTLISDLSLSKAVNGAVTDQSFSFTILLEAGSSGLDALPATYTATLNHADGTTETAELTFTNGQLKLSMCHGESLTIHGIPIGAKWTITETQADGFTTTYTVGTDSGGTVDGTGTTASGSINAEPTAVAFTNSTYYELPDTGGVGTHLYTFGGSLLSISAGALLLYKHSKRRKEDINSS